MIERRCLLLDLRSVATRHQQMDRLARSPCTQLSGNFKGDQRSQAMPIEGKRKVEMRHYAFREGTNQGVHTRKRSFSEAILPARKLHGTDIYLGGKAVLPGAKG